MWSGGPPGLAVGGPASSGLCEVLIPRLLSCASDSSYNYIRQLETKVRILEDDNNKLLSQERVEEVKV
ncbi:Coiled-coil domain-containing protein 85C-B [Liparis tanakae]|uniref:Coiled-coil domain-containing protein 85C-B n=1 Tax=Liparis tanakae TaxID=230148 RepID=A0A4Z2ES98_9TELE|nr:Coiled-coil domain-containing protein 85C-B [Liparis tanakae]